MNDIPTLTLCGNIGTDLRTFVTSRGTRGVSFRLGVSNYRVTDSGEFQNLDTNWYTVRAFDRLAEHLLRSVSKGHPVVVIGRPGANAWKDEGGEVRSELQVTATHVGPDLKFGTSHFVRAPRRGEEVADPGAPGGAPGEGSPLDEGGSGPARAGAAGGPGVDPTGADPAGADPAGADATGADPVGADAAGAVPGGAFSTDYAPF